MPLLLVAPICCLRWHTTRTSGCLAWWQRTLRAARLSSSSTSGSDGCGNSVLAFSLCLSRACNIFYTTPHNKAFLQASAMSSPTTWVSEVLDAVSLRPGSPIRQPSGSSSAVVVVELPPRSVVVVRMPLQAAPVLLPTSERHEYFAKDVMAKAGCVASSCADPGACLHCNGRGGDRIKFETAITMPAAAAAANKGGRVWLRLGLHGDGVMCPAWAVSSNHLFRNLVCYDCC